MQLNPGFTAKKCQFGKFQSKSGKTVWTYKSYFTEFGFRVIISIKYCLTRWA